MKYLLDVNALLALGVRQHEFHERVLAWASDSVSEVATCSIIELGFVRILSQAPLYGLTVSEAGTVLSRLKRRGQLNFTFITDDQDATSLPNWVQFPRQITDGHLLHLAKAHGATLATLDRKIPGAFLIPD